MCCRVRTLQVNFKADCSTKSCRTMDDVTDSKGIPLLLFFHLMLIRAVVSIPQHAQLRSA
uniref:Uncharacterized protein n=1 Tax=Setaria viridis TaxID=4556 RepID=A0A4U6UP21_SETVI|nr:hypothetical protein SEVIR_5G259766v2 [Setaria viridis]